MPARSPRVLLIAHDFPPAGGSGSNRALAFARYLPIYGWRPVVLTVEARFASNRDDALLAELPNTARVLRTPSLEASPASASTARDTSEPRARGRTGFLRRNVGHARRFPDAHAGWLPFAVRAGLREQFDVIHSTSGPFTSHLVGLLLHRLTRKPWVAELRDGWYRWNQAIFPDYPAWRGVLEARLEAAVVHQASRVVLVTERMAHAFRCQYSTLPEQHFAVVSNGFDPAQFTAANTPETEGFEVLHAGALYYGRSLASFLQAAASLVDADPDFAHAFRLRLLGTLDEAARGEIARQGLGERVRFDGSVDHASSLAAMHGASLLLLIANTTPGAEATVPGKLFEYLAVGRPVLAIAPSLESSTADVLARAGASWVARADDQDQIRRYLADAFRGARPAAKSVASFDRRFLTGELARILDDAAHRL